MHVAQLMPLSLTVSCFSEIQIGFTFLVPAHPGSPGKRALNGCVCVCVCYRFTNVSSFRFVLSLDIFSVLLLVYVNGAVIFRYWQFSFSLTKVTFRCCKGSSTRQHSTRSLASSFMPFIRRLPVIVAHCWGVFFVRRGEREWWRLTPAQSETI